MALLTAVIEDTGAPRLYFTRLGSVISYVEPVSPHCMRAVVEPGPLCWPAEYTRSAEQVRRAMIEELAARLDMLPEDVLRQPFDRVCRVADAPLAEKNPWQGRGKSRRR